MSLNNNSSLLSTYVNIGALLLLNQNTEIIPCCNSCSFLFTGERMWALQKLRKLLTTLPKLMETPFQSLLRSKGADDPHLKSITRLPSSGGESNAASGNNSVASLSFSAGNAALDVASSISSSSFFISRGLRGLPDLLLKQFDYEEPVVRAGKHLMFSPFFKVRHLIGLLISINFMKICI